MQEICTFDCLINLLMQVDYNFYDYEKVGEADSGRYLVFANMEELNDKDCFFVCFEVISEDTNAIEFRDGFGQFWRLEKK